MIQQRSSSVFSLGGPCEQFWHGQGVHSLMSLLTMALPTLQGALKDGFGETLDFQIINTILDSFRWLSL